MHEEIENRFRVPVSLEQLLQKYEHTLCDAGLRPTMQGKSWSGTIEAISRCIAAFQKAIDATEHIQCQDIATKTCDYAIALAWKTPAYCGREDLLALVHQFMQNRKHNLAFIHLLNQSCLCEHEDDSFWSLVSDLEYVRITEGSQKEECLRIIELCMDAIKNHADHLQRQMEVYNTCNHICGNGWRLGAATEHASLSAGNAGACFATQQSAELLQSIQGNAGACFATQQSTELLQSIQLHFATATMTLSGDNCYRALRATATEHGYIG